MLQAASADTKKANARGNSQPDPGPEGLLAPPVPVLGNQAMLRLQRKCDCGGGPDCDCDMGDHKKKEGESPRTALHRAPASPGAMPQTAPPIVHETLRSPGEMLDRETRAFFESRFGQDFSGVRIHTDSRAAESARAVNALAYTVGRDIAFAPGRFAPATTEGRRLLAHELTHTLQQPHRSSLGAVQTKLGVGDPGDTYEREADRVASRIMRMPDPAGPARQRRCAECAKTSEPPTAQRAAGAPASVVTALPIIRALPAPGDGGVAFTKERCEQISSTARHTLASNPASTVQHDSRSIVRRVIRSDPAAPLSDYLSGKGILGVTGDANTYSASQRSTANAEQEVLVDMLASARVFNVDGANTPDAEKSLSAHVTARLGIVAFAAQKKYSFASVTGFKMNPLYYDIFPDKLKWKLKSGVDKQAAWQDLNLNPQLYAIGCAAATELTQAGGSQGAKFQDRPSQDENDWVPGDAGYVRNKAFPGGDIGLLGENIIYVGSGQFWGHFSGSLTYRTLAEWKAEVAKWHGGGAQTASEVDSKREGPMTGLL